MILDNRSVTEYKIVISEAATETEIFSACELKKYLKCMYSVDLPIVKDNTKFNKKSFIIGGPSTNRMSAAVLPNKEFRSMVCGKEGFLAVAFGFSVILAGSDSESVYERDRCTLYAIYEFLEMLGASFAAYGSPGSKTGEYVPKNPSIDLKNINYIKKSSNLKYRTAIVQFNGYAHEISNADAGHPLTASFIDWMAKNRYNRLMLPLQSYEQMKERHLIDEVVLRGIALTVGHHDSGMFFLPPEGNSFFKNEYHKTNPEYFKLRSDGTRYKPSSKWSGQLIFDMREERCSNEIAKNIVEWSIQNPRVDTINFWPNDMDDEQCQCSKCKPFSKMENYAYFVNEIAKSTAKLNPSIKIDMLAYLDLWEPPKNFRLADNVIVEVATWGPGVILRKFGTNDGSGLLGTDYWDNAVAWSEISANTAFYDYFMTNFRSLQVYCPMADEINITCPAISASKISGVGTQIEVYNIWNYLFNFYLFGRKAYDSDMTFDEILNRFTRIFGKGAKSISDYIKYVETFCNGQTEQGKDGRFCASAFMHGIDHKKAYDYFESAYYSENDENFRDNIRMMRMVFRYSDLMINDPENIELKYISEKSGGYWSCEGQTGKGFAAFPKPEKTNFTPDKWYEFSN